MENIVTDTSNLLWKRFEEFHTDTPDAGMEKFNPVRFKRTYQIYLMAHFNNRIIELDEKFQLPTGSILHVLDDIYHPEDHSDVPRVGENRFIQQESFLKYIYHVTDFDLAGPVTIEDKYIYRQAGLPKALLSFRAKYGSAFKYLNHLDKIPLRKETLTIINYNPLFRAKYLGTLKYFRKIQMILATLLNTCVKAQPHEKQQFILIPWSGEVFSRNNFLRSRKELTKVTIMHNESFHYIFMMHLVNYLWSDETTSIFNKVPMETLKQMNFILQSGDKYLIFNMADIKGFNANNRVYLKFINQLNLLAVLGHEHALSEEEKSVVYRDIEEEASTDKESGLTVKAQDSTLSDEQLEETMDTIEAKQIAKVEEKDKEEALVPGLVTKVADMAKSAVAGRQVGLYGVHSVAGGVKTTTIKASDEADTVDDEVETKENYDEVIDTSAEEFIEKDEKLTPKAKEHFKKIAKTYKKLTLDGVPLETILKGDKDTALNLDEDKLDRNQLGIELADAALTNSIKAYDKQYMRHQFKKDLVSNLISFQSNGVYLTGLKAEKVVDELNNITKYTANYTDIRGKKSTVKFTIPNPMRDGTVLIDGVKQVLRKQRINLPIVKINDTEVSLASNQNKTRVIRNTAKAHSYFTSVEKTVKDADGLVTVIYGNYKPTLRLPYEYTAIAERYTHVSFVSLPTKKKVKLIFDYPERKSLFPGDEKDMIKLESECGTFFGVYGTACLFLDSNNKINAVVPSDGEVAIPYTRILPLLNSVFENKVTKTPAEWINLKILDKLIPVIFVLAYRQGLRKTLRDMGVKYVVTERRSKTIVFTNEDNLTQGTESINYTDTVAGNINDTISDVIASGSVKVGIEDNNEDATSNKYVPQDGDIPIKFADKILWINRYPMKHSLITSGLENYDLTSYDMAEFESRDVYFDIMQNMKLSINYLKGIDSFFDLFIDGMTFNVLKSMKMPTTVDGLLYKSAEMLATTEYRNPSSRANHRIRGFEQFNAIVYNEMARQFAAYQAGRGATNTFSVNPEAIYLRIIQNQTLLASEAANPIQDLKDQAGMTYAGMGGRTAESFVIEDRKYSADDIGVISEATVDNSKVGIVANLSYNPNIDDVTGALSGDDPDKMDPTQMLSAATLLFPFSTQDDSKRMNFIGIQSSHLVPTIHTDRNRVRTGFERTMAHRVGREFACMAERDGKVTAIDEKAQTIVVTYKNGDVDVFRYGHVYSKIQSFEVDQDIVPAVKLGQTLKKGEVIAYNKGYFTMDPKTKQLDMTTGIMANVALLETDTTLEDSTEISQRLSQKLTLRPVNMRFVMVNRKSLIYMIRKVGDEVQNTDDLMVFDEDPIDTGEQFKGDADTLSALGDLNKRTPKAKYNGTIVDIDAYAGCTPNEMSPSLSAIFRAAVDRKNRRAKLSAGTMAEDDFRKSSVIPAGSKYKGYSFDEDSVLLCFRIQEDIPQDKGDKMVFCNQLKCTVTGVFPEKVTTHSGVEIDAFFSCSAICRRICASPFLHGILARIMRKVESDFVAIAKGTKK